MLFKRLREYNKRQTFTKLRTNDDINSNKRCSNVYTNNNKRCPNVHIKRIYQVVEDPTMHAYTHTE